MGHKGKARGGWLGSMRMKLNKTKLSPEAVDVVMEVLSGKPKVPPVIVPASIVRHIEGRLQRDRLAVVLQGKNGFKVFSLPGYEKFASR